MKATDFMLGDYVYVHHHGIASHYGKVTALLPTGAVETEIDGSISLSSSVEPIPLTLEILEKNGFGEYEYNEVYGDEIEVEVNLNEWPIDEGSCPGFSSQIQYVHELQHALRLCGIEKEIVL